MEHQAITILRYISLLQRNTRRYFDLMLEQDQIGSGQQFFLLRIFENDGISMQDLARLGSFDKGTVWITTCPRLREAPFSASSCIRRRCKVTPDESGTSA